jgi:hypothetical protein
MGGIADVLMGSYPICLRRRCETPGGGDGEPRTDLPDSDKGCCLSHHLTEVGATYLCSPATNIDSPFGRLDNVFAT